MSWTVPFSSWLVAAPLFLRGLSFSPLSRD